MKNCEWIGSFSFQSPVHPYHSMLPNLWRQVLLAYKQHWIIILSLHWLLQHCWNWHNFIKWSVTSDWHTLWWTRFMISGNMRQKQLWLIRHSITRSTSYVCGHQKHHHDYRESCQEDSIWKETPQQAWGWRCHHSTEVGFQILQDINWMNVFRIFK